MNGVRKSFFSRHKTGGIILVLLALAAGGYGIYRQSEQPKNTTRSILATVEKGTLTSTVAGSGQISVSNQIDIKPKVSGDLVLLNAAQGSEVKEGSVIGKIDDADAQKAVRDAKTNLLSAQLSFEKLKAPADRLTLLQTQHALEQAKEAKDKADKDLETAQIDFEKLKLFSADPLAVTQAKNALTSAKEARQKADDTLSKAYDDGFGTIVSSFLDFPVLLSGMNDMFFQSTTQKNTLNIDWYANQVSIWDGIKTAQYRQNLATSYDGARAQYTAALASYKSASRSSDHATLDALVVQATETVTDIDTSIKAGKNFLDYVQDQIQWHGNTVPQVLTSDRNSLDTFIGKSNTDVTTIANAKRSINVAQNAIAGADRTLEEKTESLTKLTNSPDPLDVRAQELVVNQKKQAVVDAQRAIDEKTESLKKLTNGPDPLDVRSQELTIQQRQDSLRDAKEKLADYTVVAPFDAIIAQSNTKKGDTVSPSTVIATVITKQKIADVTLNEVDVSKIAQGQKAILTLDALPDVSISGAVAQIDTLGTVSQGVVSYTAKITFDTQDERVKPGMTVSATIITNVRTDVLTVPNTAIKTQGDTHYVEMPANDDPSAAISPSGVILSKPTRRVQVEIGISNDESTEITTGLKEGDVIVSNSLSAQNSTSGSTNRAQQQSPAIRIPGLPGGGGGGGFRGGGF